MANVATTTTATTAKQGQVPSSGSQPPTTGQLWPRGGKTG